MAGMRQRARSSRSLTAHRTVQAGKTLASTVELNPDRLLDALASVSSRG